MDESKEVRAATADLVSIAIDAAVGVPLAEGIRSISSLGDRVRAWHFDKKTEAFIDDLNATDPAESQRLLSKLDADPDRKHRILTLILTELDRVESEEKARLLRRAVWWYLRDDRSLQDVQHVVAAIERCFVSDLEHLNPGDRPVEYPTDVGARLSGCGLINIDTVPPITGPGATASWCITEFGRNFYNAVVDST